MKLTNRKAKCIKKFDCSNRIIIDRIYDVYEGEFDNNYFIKDENNTYFYLWTKFLKLMSIEESRNHTIKYILNNE